MKNTLWAHGLRRLAIVSLLALTAGCAELGVSESPETPPPQDKKAEQEPAKDAGKTAAESKTSEYKRPPAATIHKGTGALIKPTPAEKPPTGAANITLNFEAADVRDIAKTVLAEILKESYIVDPKVQGTISFRTTRPLAKEALLPTLETVLRMNGVVMVKENGIFKVMPAANVKGSLSPQTGSAIAGFTMQVVPLKFVGAKEMGKMLESVAADPNLVKVDEIRNLLILAGTQNEIRHMLDAVDMFDVDWMSGMSVGLFILQSADVKTIDNELGKVFGGDKSGAGNPLAGVVRFIPIERLNGFIIITPQPKYLEQAKMWLERLDRVGSTGGVRLFVYQVQNGKAEHLADLLNQTFGGQGGQATQRPTTPTVAPGLTGTQTSSTSARGGLGSASTAQSQAQQQRPAATPAVGATLTIADESGGPGDQVRVVADKENNALLILANSSGYEKIEAALRKLDVSPRQVLIEVTIAEVTLKDELEFGIEWLFTNGPRRSGKLDLGTAGLNVKTPGFSYTVTAGDTIKSVLNMLATDNKINILSSPHIMVADNQTARILVGDSVPTSGPQTVVGTGTVVSSTQYLDTGIMLQVTPRINSGGLVSLDVSQEVSTAQKTTTSALDSPTISKRSAKTIVTVQSGETMVLGGLISEQSTSGSAGLPGLSSIPILGGLFGTQSDNRSKTELVVMITPRVANSFNQAKTLSDELRRKMGNAKDLVDCGTSSVLGYSSRGGLWCMQPGRFDGAIDRMEEKDASGRPLYPPPAAAAPAVPSQK